ncbi:MAG: TolC family protein [Burkholderiales bacterium]
MSSSLSETARRVPAGLLVLTLAACSVQPVPLTQSDIRGRVDADQKQIYAGQEAVAQPIGFYDALARSLRYNLDYRLKLMESALATGLADVARFDMLPQLVLSAGYRGRSNDSGGLSVGIEDRQVSLRPSTSDERTRLLAGAEFSWNVLDFGLSYYRAKQAADESLIAEERRRRVVHNIVQDVRGAYWRALGAQRLAGKADELMTRARTALEQSRKAEAQGLIPPAQALAYQRALLDATTLLNIRRQELEFAKRELAALMNVPAGVNFTLAETAEPALPPLPANVAELEDLALNRRPELREEDYRKRISTAETRRAILGLMPGLSLDAAVRHDSNKYLYNQAWSEGGLRVFGNLLRLTSLPSVKRMNEARLKTDDARRLALSMAVLTQARVSLERYKLALVDLEVSDESARVDERLAAFARAARSTKVDTELEVIRTEARALVTQFQRHAAYANAQVALGRIFNSLGVDPLPESGRYDDLAALSQGLQTHMNNWPRDIFKAAAADTGERPRVAIDVSNLPSIRHAESVRAAVTKVLENDGYVVAPLDPSAWRLGLRLEMAPSRDGMRRGEWAIALHRPQGGAVGESRYVSTLAADFTPSTAAAFSEAAALSSLGQLDAWTRGPGTADAR